MPPDRAAIKPECRHGVFMQPITVFFLPIARHPKTLEHKAYGLFHRRHRLPSQLFKQPDGMLFDELIFCVGVGTHA